MVIAVFGEQTPYLNCLRQLEDRSKILPESLESSFQLKIILMTERHFGLPSFSLLRSYSFINFITFLYRHFSPLGH